MALILFCVICCFLALFAHRPATPISEILSSGAASTDVSSSRGGEWLPGLALAFLCVLVICSFAF